MSVAKVVERGQPFQDEGKNRWLWTWTERWVEHADGKSERVGEHIRKIDISGKARCMLCSADISYSSRGWPALLAHMKTDVHKKMRKAVKNSSASGHPSKNDQLYGMDPFYKTAVDKSPQTGGPVTPLSDRIANFEAMTLAFAVENNLSMAVVPKLIEFAKAMIKDEPALEMLDKKYRTSYKMVQNVKRQHSFTTAATEDAEPPCKRKKPNDADWHKDSVDKGGADLTVMCEDGGDSVGLVHFGPKQFRKRQKKPTDPRRESADKDGGDQTVTNGDSGDNCECVHSESEQSSSKQVPCQEQKKAAAEDEIVPLPAHKLRQSTLASFWKTY